MIPPKLVDRIEVALFYLIFFLALVNVICFFSLFMGGASAWTFSIYFLFALAVLLYIVNLDDERKALVIIKWLMFVIILDTVGSTKPLYLIFLHFSNILSFAAVAYLYYLLKNKISYFVLLLSVIYVALILLPIEEIYWKFFSLGLVFMLLVDFIFSKPPDETSKTNFQSGSSVKPNFLRDALNNSIRIMLSFGMLIGTLYATGIINTVQDGVTTPEIHVKRILQQDKDNYPGQRIGAICYDGTEGELNGLKTCAHHGGVVEWIYKPPLTLEKAKKRALKKSWYNFE